MFCMKCGSPVDANDRFCGKCGAKRNVEGPGIPAQLQPGVSQGVSSYQLTIKRTKQFLQLHTAKITINGMDRGTLKNGMKSTYTVDTDIVTIKITPKDLLARSLKLKLQLYSNALIQFSILTDSVVPGAFLENLSGATILQ